VLAALMFQPQPLVHAPEFSTNQIAWLHSYYRDTVARQRKAFFERRGFADGDLDLFLYALTPEQATAKIQALYEHLRSLGDTTIVRTKLAVTFMQDFPRRVIQVVLRVYKSPAEVLAGFDVDACCVAYDGERVWATTRAKRALNGMVNVADSSRQSLTYESRLFKYSTRGFVTCVPGFDKQRVSLDIFDREMGDVHGMARLLLLERLVDPRSIYHTPLDTPTASSWTAQVRSGPFRRLPVDRSPLNSGTAQVASITKLVMAGVANVPASDYSGFIAKVKKGFHPFGQVSLCIKGAIDAQVSVALIAARNDFASIIDIGESGASTLRLWRTAKNEDLFDYRWEEHTNEANREPNADFIDSHLAPTTFRPAVPRRIEYVTHDAGRQMIGSFHPIDRDFFSDAYGEA